MINPPATWKPGMDLPYTLSVGDAFLAIMLRPSWLKADPSGMPVLLPPAVRAIDRLRAVFARETRITPGFITALREAMHLSQTQFGAKLGVSKITVSRWERGRMRPGPEMHAAILKLQDQARSEGVIIDAEKRTSRHSAMAERFRHAG